MTDDQLDEAIRLAAAGCCMDDAWRGRKCPYHEGMAEGFEAMNSLWLDTLKMTNDMAILADRVWGEGNWMVCDDCLDTNGRPSCHSVRFHK